MAGQDRYLDAMATGVAEATISRARTIKLTGAALLGSALSLFVAAGEAEAHHLSDERRRCRRRGGTYCFGPHRGAYAAGRIGVLRRGSAREGAAASVVCKVKGRIGR